MQQPEKWKALQHNVGIDEVWRKIINEHQLPAYYYSNIVIPGYR